MSICIFLRKPRSGITASLARNLNCSCSLRKRQACRFILPKGMTIRTELEEFARELQRQRDYDEVRTPLMMNNRLWEQSGHWDHYNDNMYFTDVDDKKFALKPMNCPGHMLIFKNSLAFLS